jgi:hypothetical protein
MQAGYDQAYSWVGKEAAGVDNVDLVPETKVRKYNSSGQREIQQAGANATGFKDEATQGSRRPVNGTSWQGSPHKQLD